MKKYTETLPDGTTFTMLPIQGGSFMMGSNESDREQPIHRVTVPDFYLCEHLVTQAVWQAIMGNNPSHFKGKQKNPVENVSWHDVQAFIEKLNAWEKTHPNTDRPPGYYCLPSEAQWEYAARGGNLSQGFTYAGSNHLDEVGYYDRNSAQQTRPVGLLYPNELGLYDMSGNVWEWCQDEWHKNYEGAPTDGSAKGNTKDTIIIKMGNILRVVRGGSWLNNPLNCPVSCRRSSNHYDPMGCRLSRCLTL